MTVSIEEGSGIVIGRPDCDLHFGRQMQGGHASLKDIQGAMRFSAVSTNQSCPASRNAENAVSLVGYNDADSKRNPPGRKLSESIEHGYYIILRQNSVYDGLCITLQGQSSAATDWS